jgi:hypothetical protein
MKKVLSLLVVFVFLNVQSWAFAPVYPTTSQNVSGTYAGVLTPINQIVTSSASIGVFAVGIPASTSGTTVSSGAAVLFANGAGYPSFVNGVFDPQSATLTAIIEGSASVSSTVSTVTGNNVLTGQPIVSTAQTSTQIFAQGTMSASLKAPPTKRGIAVQNGPGTAGAERIEGVASIDLFSTTNANGTPNISSTINFTVNGFQQTSVFSVPTITIIVPGSQTGTTGI